MQNGFFQSVDVTATGTYLDSPASGMKFLGGARLVAAAAAATMVIRETDGSGRVLARLSAPINGSDDWEPQCPVAFTGKIHVTLGGAGALANVFEA